MNPPKQLSKLHHIDHILPQFELGSLYDQAKVFVLERGSRRVIARQRSKRLFSSAGFVAFVLFFIHHFVGVADVKHQIEPLRIKAVK